MAFYKEDTENKLTFFYFRVYINSYLYEISLMETQEVLKNTWPDLLNTLEQKENISEQISSIVTLKWCNTFLTMEENGIYILTKNIKPKEFIQFLDDIFSKWYFLSHLHYKLFEKILFWDESFTTDKIKIAQKIEKIDPSYSKIIQKPKISSDQMSCEYIFSPVYDPESQENEGNTIRKEIPIDIFIAMMWSYGVKFGLHYEEIEASLIKNEVSHITIATGKEVIQPIPPKLQTLIPLWYDPSGKYDTIHKRIEIKNYKRMFPWVEKDTRLYKKIPGSHGIPWRTIWGTMIQSGTLSDIEIPKIIWKWITIMRENGEEYLVANTAWFVVPAIWNYKSSDYLETPENLPLIEGHNISHEISIHDSLHVDEISAQTGNLEIPFWVEVKKDIERGFSLTALSAKIHGYVSWILHSRYDVCVHGSVIGQGSSFTQRLAHEENGWISSAEWNIELLKIVSNASIESKNGKIEVDSIDGTILFWEEIDISDARNSLIVGNHIKISKQARGCIIIVGHHMDIQTLKNYEENENLILFLYSSHYYDTAQEKKENIKQLQEQIPQHEEKITNIQTQITELLKNKNFQELITIYQKKSRGLEVSKDDLAYLNLPYQQSQLRNYAKYLSEIKHHQQLIEHTHQEITDLEAEIEALLELHAHQPKPTWEITSNQNTFQFGYIWIPNYETWNTLDHKIIQHLLEYQNLQWEKKYLWTLERKEETGKIIFEENQETSQKEISPKK